MLTKSSEEAGVDLCENGTRLLSARLRAAMWVIVAALVVDDNDTNRQILREMVTECVVPLMISTGVPAGNSAPRW